MTLWIYYSTRACHRTIYHDARYEVLMLGPKRTKGLLWFKRRLSQIMAHPSALALSIETGAPQGHSNGLSIFCGGWGGGKRCCKKSASPPSCAARALHYLSLYWSYLLLPPRIISRAGFIDIVDLFEQYSGTVSNRKVLLFLQNLLSLKKAQKPLS